MLYAILPILGQFIIILTRCDFASAKALLGSRIRVAEENEFPSVVCIATLQPSEAHPDDVVICTGVLISSSHILTSEHCLTDENEPFQVIIGSVDLSMGERRLPLWWLSYDWWTVVLGLDRENPLNDISMLRLLENAPEHVSPAIVAFQPLSNYLGSYVTLPGWGTADSGSSPRILNVATVRVISNDDCEALVLRLQGFYNTLPEKYICTVAEPYALLGDGDSGGPILRGNSVIGISEGLCPKMNDIFHPEKANVHNSVYYYRRFIIQAMNMP